MKNLQKTLLLSIAMAMYPNVYAQAQDKHFDQSFKLGFEGGYYDYQEPGLMKNVGGLYGAFGEYKLHVAGMNPLLPDTFMLESNVKGGSVDYSSNGTGTSDDDTHFLGEARILLGKEIQATNSLKLMPFLGFGYRYLNVDFAENKTSTGHFGYERESNYLYVPVGLKMNTAVNQDWDLDIAAEYDVFIDGEQKSHLSNGSFYYPDIVNEQNHGYGVRASVDLTKKTSSVGFLMGTYLRWWDIGASDKAYLGQYYYAVEPKNESLEVGVRVGLTF